MHETRIARSILEVLVYRLTDRRGTCSAASVKVKVGELRGVSVDGLLFAFDAIKETYPNCGKCELIAMRSQAAARCAAGHQYQPGVNFDACSVCGQPMAELLNGQELEITDITIFDCEGQHQYV